MKFKSLVLRSWRQFDEINIEFHERVTIITGSNGAGKSTILRVLGQHFGWPQDFLATPIKTKNNGVTGELKKLFNGVKKLFNPEQPNNNQVGELTYSNNVSTKLLVPQTNNISYSLQTTNQQPILGLYIGSHRPTQSYQQITNIPTNVITADAAFQSYSNETKTRYVGGHSQHSPVYRMKEAIISMATFGPGNQYVEKNHVLEKTFSDFKNVLRNVLPHNLGFLDISIRIPDVVLVTKSGEFLLDSSSGGLMAIIDLAWQIFLFSQDKEDFIVAIDEPENHLHPSMQRSLMVQLVNAFPRAQFIIATHSPFIVSSIKDSSVYALRYSDVEPDLEFNYSRHVKSDRLGVFDKSGTASEILRSVLGVPITMPEWVETELSELSSKYSIDSLNQESIALMKADLAALGLESYYPDLIKIVAGRND